jgi:hypothetical protein
LTVLTMQIETSKIMPCLYTVIAESLVVAATWNT